MADPLHPWATGTPEWQRYEDQRALKQTTGRIWRWPRLLRAWSAMRRRKFKPLHFAIRNRDTLHGRQAGRRWLKENGFD